MRIILMFVAILLGSLAPAAADDVGAAQAVIRAQEQAFGRDDAAAAYSHAAPAIRQIFPQADIFMSMVQNQYAPVYRHRSFEFGEARSDGDRIAQRVHIVDANGEAWEALYTLERQADGSLKITGCSFTQGRPSGVIENYASATRCRARIMSSRMMLTLSRFQARPLAKAAA
ncbi:hypothetical protein J2R76_007615 [Bradyrhizobium sp. USDA 4532]|nr:hypothetical protein [Bradyrhizobium sp. USDA 4545]MCP1924024.1 hypothetical protein [Bradyrhizobium sp. USDA 4532]